MAGVKFKCVYICMCVVYECVLCVHVSVYTWVGYLQNWKVILQIFLPI